ncbi:Glycosyl hydrolase family 67 N-terminus [Flavobacterium aquidurense]|uniref:Glycosyl hydrolase n=1 Tax=Flavobacterium frigidimaris TaxID=262320 RepID=A0ABX4BJS6_FLAFR|nr:glycosyl hydrolase 115 family protein [Flavobacterium frigidimaris]OXA75192.1 glycosyl hydrolase [Flavobacterium frigidimaris]SDZ66709.1 Glycosyl hydrolase family 67 N-terminus [Flavobacterium aquidurense]
MNKFLAFIFAISTLTSYSQDKNSVDFLIADKNQTATIYIDKNTDALILWAINDLADDVKEITGKRPEIIQNNTISKNGIYIGEASSSLFQSQKNRKEFANQGEKFSIQKEQENLLVMGSDVRGTVYAIFEIAERLGISPWKWWADVHPIKKEKLALQLPRKGIIASPSVQYRGVFLNDEDWALQPWAAKTFEPETGDIGPKTYEKIFQLLLRLKANTIWPAMHPSTKGFFTLPGNKEMAQKYHIVIGSSHAEPMLRNNVDEWKPEIYGEYNYFTNKTQVDKYWQDRLDEIKKSQNETIMTLGMRGVHDSKMEGAKDLAASIDMVEKIILNQRKMLSNTFKKPLSAIPQAFVPYKEVLELYDNGLKVPDDITLVWPDDNYGYIRRLSNEKEQKRAGGSGVYYHISYWGRPHDYLWLSTTQPGLIWYEMNKAYENGAKKMWIVNVGDIKPAEYDTELFLDLAWNINSIKSDGLKAYSNDWAAREFSPKISVEVSTIFDEYYRLAFLRKPEYMGWSQTEPTTPIKLSDFSVDEIWSRIKAYKTLIEKVDSLTSSIPEERKDAWFQLVVYPVKGAAYMNFKFLYWNLEARTSDENEKKKYDSLSAEAYQKIKDLTDFYNAKLSSGKWNHMMSLQPRNLPVFDSIKKNTFSTESAKTSSKQIVIQANQFVSKKETREYQWKTINGLGYSDNAITLFPLKQHYFKTEKPFVCYEFEIENTGEYEIEVHLLPTHSNNFDHEIGVQIDGNVTQFFKTNTKDRDTTWKENVLRNSAIIKVSASNLQKGKHTIKVEVNQTGIVLDYITVKDSKI